MSRGGVVWLFSKGEGRRGIEWALIGGQTFLKEEEEKTVSSPN